jgi:hypothetical protein
MTEVEWLYCTDPKPMLEFLPRKVSSRKLRLFACACWRRVQSLLSEEGRRAIDVAERYADGLATQEDLAVAEGEEMDAADERESCATGCAVSRFAVQDALGASDKASQASLCQVAEFRVQADILRHLIGNPFRPYPAPDHWPSSVVQLAESLYNGQDCTFALHDALLETGHAGLAEHFKEKEHPKGCWVLDLIMGKE